MKKLFIILLFASILAGCTTNDNNDTNKGETITEENSIWVINSYTPMSYDEFYSQERQGQLTDSNGLVAKASELVCCYGSDDEGLYVASRVPTNYDGSYVEKQYIVKDSMHRFYFSVAGSDGYWFYYAKTDYGDTRESQLVRVNYKGEEEVIIEDFSSDIYATNAYLVDKDVLVTVRNDAENMVLELYYLNGMEKQEIDTGLPANSYIEIYPQSSSYHLTYRARNPQYLKAYNELMADNQKLLKKYLDLYHFELIDGKDAYNDNVIRYIILGEYNAYINADFDYDIINKTLTYQPLQLEVDLPRVDDDNAK
ncbi:MAG: hypothetical protein ACI4WG_03265 [Erysipelotrichaceae bacterium]